MLCPVLPTRGTTSAWASSSYVGRYGELLVEETIDGEFLIKIGNGVDLFSALPYVTGGGGGAPAAHAASHADGGSDEVTVALSQVTGLATTLFNLGNEITDHTFEDYTTAHGGLASAAQGALADTAVQPGDLPATTVEWVAVETAGPGSPWYIEIPGPIEHTTYIPPLTLPAGEFNQYVLVDAPTGVEPSWLVTLPTRSSYPDVIAGIASGNISGLIVYLWDGVDPWGVVFDPASSSFAAQNTGLYTAIVSPLETGSGWNWNTVAPGDGGFGVLSYLGMERALYEPDAPGGVPLLRSAFQSLDSVRSAATMADPFTIMVFGDSQASITQPTFATHMPWPMMLSRYLGGMSTDGFFVAKGDSQTRSMTGTNGATGGSVGVAGWASVLDPGEYAYHSVLAKTVRVYYTAGAGSIQVRNGSVGGTLLANIDTTAVTGSGNFIDLTVGTELPDVYFGFYFGSLYFVASGGVCTLDAVSLRSANVEVVNASHGGYSGNTYTAFPAVGLEPLAKLTPDLVFLALGTNDAPGTVVTRCRDLIDAAMAASPNSVFAFIIPPVSLSFTAAEVLLLRDLVAEYDTLELIDLSQLISGGRALAPPESGDTLHFSKVGHGLFAKYIAGRITGDLWAYNHAATTLRADEGGYVAATSGDWNATPYSIADGLDELASRTNTVEDNAVALLHRISLGV